MFSRFQNTAGELGRSPSLALYTEGIIKFSKLRLGDLKRGEKSLQPWLPMMLKKKIFNTFSQSSGGNNKVVTPELKDRWANCKLVPQIDPSVPQPVFTITEKAPTRAFLVESAY